MTTLELNSPLSFTIQPNSGSIQYGTTSDLIIKQPITAAAPVAPPREWFELPDPDADVYDVVIEADGRVHGYPAASWDACHLGYSDQCVSPPRSRTDYAYFKVGNVLTADGTRIKTGPLTLRGGHADRTLSAAKAMAFYDDTDSAFADVNIGENERGIWIAGAIRPTTTPEAVRAAMGSGFSGDWRWVGDGHELIALSAVNTPGFRHNATIFEQYGMVASMILDIPRSASPVDHSDGAAGDVVGDALVASAINRIATSIGRSVDQRLAAVVERVQRAREVA